MQAAPPIHLRDFMAIKPMGEAVPLNEVESVTAIRKRFVTPGMSLGALSPEAHKKLNVAMNRIGARSGSGEGGEDPTHFSPEANGDNPSAKIKPVGSSRFGVTAEYLNQSEELEIKIAQGAELGEGGQLPGIKVTELIARLRLSTPGVTLISPPPHHDIYSIKDPARLIYDLKQINPHATVTVKMAVQRWREDAASLRGAEYGPHRRHAPEQPYRVQVRHAQHAPARPSDGETVGQRSQYLG